MKKLMVMALVAGAAIVSHAAATTWSTGYTYYDGVGSQLNDEGGTDQFSGNAYLFTGLTLAQYQALTSEATIWDNFTANGDSSTLKIGDNTLTVTDWGALVDGGYDFSKTTSMEFPAGNAYAAVIVTHETDSVVDAYSASAMYASSDLALTGADQVALGWGDGTTFDNPANPTTWQAVPEPTSGLLLLLGMAGLALKRKRA